MKKNSTFLVLAALAIFSALFVVSCGDGGGTTTNYITQAKIPGSLLGTYLADSDFYGNTKLIVISDASLNTNTFIVPAGKVIQIGEEDVPVTLSFVSNAILVLEDKDGLVIAEGSNITGTGTIVSDASDEDYYGDLSETSVVLSAFASTLPAASSDVITLVAGKFYKGTFTTEDSVKADTGGSYIFGSLTTPEIKTGGGALNVTETLTTAAIAAAVKVKTLAVLVVPSDDDGPDVETLTISASTTFDTAAFSANSTVTVSGGTFTVNESLSIAGSFTGAIAGTGTVSAAADAVVNGITLPAAASSIGAAANAITLKADYTIPESGTLTIGATKTVTVASGVTLDVSAAGASIVLTKSAGQLVLEGAAGAGAVLILGGEGDNITTPTEDFTFTGGATAEAFATTKAADSIATGLSDTAGPAASIKADAAYDITIKAGASVDGTLNSSATFEGASS